MIRNVVVVNIIKERMGRCVVCVCERESGKRKKVVISEILTFV